MKTLRASIFTFVFLAVLLPAVHATPWIIPRNSKKEYPMKRCRSWKILAGLILVALNGSVDAGPMGEGLTLRPFGAGDAIAWRDWWGGIGLA